MKIINKLTALWSPAMRSTLERERLNDIWGRFNARELSSSGAIDTVLNYKWKYHKDMVKLFLSVCNMLK